MTDDILNQIGAREKEIERLKLHSRLRDVHNHAALLDHLRLLHDRVNLAPGASLDSYADGWKAGIQAAMNIVPLP